MNQPKIVVVGSLNMDIVVETQRTPDMGETVLGNNVHFVPGGKGANQAVAAARLGAATTLIGAVGADAFGDKLLASLRENQVNIDPVKVETGVPTGVALIVLANRDNQIIVVPGANSFCLPQDLAQYESYLQQADVVLLQLEIPLDTVCAAAEMAKRHGKKVIVNPAPARELPSDLLKHVDVITPNRSELALLTGYNDDEWEKAMQSLLQSGPQVVVTTLGAQGAAYLTRGGGLKTVPAYKVPVVDSTGAGDAFNAGVAYALASGMKLQEAVLFASKVAALAVTRLGAQAGMPTREEVEAFHGVFTEKSAGECEQ